MELISRLQTIQINEKPNQQLSDAELMKRVKEGDYIAFDQIFQRYRTPIQRFLFSLTWDQEAAEDCLQEVFLQLYRARDRYEPTGKFTTYLFQIAKNCYLNYSRKNKNKTRETPLEDVSKPLENLRANEKTEPEVHLLAEYQRWRIRRAISLLPDHLKIVFVMSHFEEMKYLEIAEVLQIPLGTVKSRMNTAVKTLKKMLKEEEL
jgi:RNA polymerase sigma-70 factor (ECF subfamily)